MVTTMKRTDRFSYNDSEGKPLYENWTIAELTDNQLIELYEDMNYREQTLHIEKLLYNALIAELRHRTSSKMVKYVEKNEPFAAYAISNTSVIVNAPVEELCDSDLITLYEDYMGRVGPNQPAPELMLNVGSEILLRAEHSEELSKYVKEHRIFHDLPTAPYSDPTNTPIGKTYGVYAKFDGYSYVIDVNPYTCGKTDLSRMQALDRMEQLVIKVNNNDSSIDGAMQHRVWVIDPLDYEYKNITKADGFYIK